MPTPSPDQHQPHDSNSEVQVRAERIVLESLASQLGVELRQGVILKIDGASVKPDGVSPDESVLVEVFVRVGKLKPAHHEKVARDTLKLLALAETRPRARLIVAFVDHEAADSIVGWQAAVQKRNKVETLVVEIPKPELHLIVSAQVRQKRGMRNSGPSADGPS